MLINGQNVEVVDATREHAIDISERMRKQDVRELKALGLRPREAMLLSLASSLYVKTVTIDGVPAFMFGVSPISAMHRKGCPWMLGTDLIDKVNIRFIRECKNYLDDISAEFPHLENYIDVRQKKNIRWLKWLGFEMFPAQSLGKNGEMFRRFLRVAA